LERVAQIAAGCVWLACSPAGNIEAGAMATVGAGGVASLIGDGLGKQGIESGQTLARIRQRTRERVEARYGNLGSLMDVREADEALAADLRDCFLDRNALAAAALDPGGF